MKAVSEIELIKFFDLLDAGNKIEKFIHRCERCTDLATKGPCSRHSRSIWDWLDKTKEVREEIQK